MAEPALLKQSSSTTSEKKQPKSLADILDSMKIQDPSKEELKGDQQDPTAVS
jgi:hypothetical protein